MCGRYRLARKKEILTGIFDAGDDADWAPRYNVAPGQDVPVIRQDATRPVRFLSLMRWGLVPSWATDHKTGYKMINARAETVADKPAFREPLQSRRCLLPADAFYEWPKDGKAKLPHCFARADDSVFALAGLWDRWRNAKGDVLSTCSIITTTANALVSGIHDRMPVILEPESYDLWLDPGFRKTEPLLDLLKPCPPQFMRSWRVGPRVNSVMNDDAECSAEYRPPPVLIPPQGTLF